MRYIIISVAMLALLTACGGNRYYRHEATAQDSLLAWYNDGGLAYREGRMADAAACFRRVAESDEHFPSVYFNLGLACAAMSDTNAAENAFRRQTVLQPQDDASWRALGLLALQRRQPEQALAHYRRALVIKPDDAQSLLGAGKAAWLCGMRDVALPYLEQARASAPLDADIACTLGLLYRETGREAEGRQLLEEAARLGSAEAFEFMGK